MNKIKKVLYPIKCPNCAMIFFVEKETGRIERRPKEFEERDLLTKQFSNSGLKEYPNVR